MFLRFNVRLNPRKGVLVSEGRGRSTELTLFPRFKITINTIHPLFPDRVCRGRKWGGAKPGAVQVAALAWVQRRASKTPTKCK